MKRDEINIALSDCPDVLGVYELQGVLQIGRASVYKLLATGEIPCFRIGSTYKIPKIAVAAYLTRKSQGEERKSNDGKFASQR